MRHSLCPERFHDLLRLVGGHHLILPTLKNDHGIFDLISMKHRRPGMIFLCRFWQGTDQRIGVTRFKFMRIHRQGEQVRHAISTDSGFIQPGEADQRIEDGIAARAAAFNHQFTRVAQVLINQRPGCAGCVNHVQVAPIAAQRFAVGSSVPRTAAIIDRQVTVTPIGKERRFQVVTHHNAAGRSAMDMNNNRR